MAPAKTNASFRRVIWIVLDGVGAGELPDAPSYGDQGSNTLANVAREFQARSGRAIRLPHMEAWGLGNITAQPGVPPRERGRGEGAFGRAREKSLGKDTTSGHWEMAGLVVSKAFAVFPHGFPADVVDRWVKENGLPGVLGNKAASGTTIIEELGAEHLRTGKPILYTSADSVWQVAAHEEAFGLERLYSICKSARKIGDELQLGRVIARPFVGNPAAGIPFKRTYHRKDYAQLPFGPTVLDELTKNGISTLGIGKISNIYAGRGVGANIDTEGNADGLRVLREQLEQFEDGLIFCNLIDFDMLYGHRRDVQGFALALEEFDAALPGLQSKLREGDLLLIASDHGNDPTFPGSDHTREYIPLLAFTPGPLPHERGPSAPTGAKKGPLDLGIREGFSDLGATVLHALLGTPAPAGGLAGRSFLPEIVTPWAPGATQAP